MIEADRKEIRRYIGLKNAEVPEVDAMIERCLERLQKVIRPVCVFRTFPVVFEDGMPVIAGKPTFSKDLARNLAGCREAVLLACTISAEADRCIRRAESVSSLEGTVMNACGSALAEAYCESLNREITAKYAEQGIHTKPRYSPGYGDLSLSFQKEFFELLNVTKYTGIVLNDSFMMVPLKSITAVIGLAEDPTDCADSGCETCSKQNDCEYRRM